jgi:hypothetical protein
MVEELRKLGIQRCWMVASDTVMEEGPMRSHDSFWAAVLLLLLMMMMIMKVL